MKNIIKIINIIFPFKLNLNILQLEEYKPSRFLKWVIRNFFVREISTKKQLVITSKVKNIILISVLLTFFFPLLTVFIFQSFLPGIILLAILLLQPYIVLTTTVLLIRPYEMFNRKKTIERMRKKILDCKNLKVIGITGSFGKSSTKEILYQLIKNKYFTLRTPESFNTVFGVAKVIDLEFDKTYKYFICEMAAYKKGEIQELCQMVPPHYAILTGITTQHFERFGSLENTIKAKFELLDSIKNNNNIVINTTDVNVVAEIKRREIKLTESKIKYKNVRFDKHGSSFDLVINNKTYNITASLFGFAQVKNIILAAEMALRLGLSEKELVENLRRLKPVDNRLVLINDKETTIVNNTYSSNPQGFRETIATAKLIKNKKVLVTPGLVELGKLETEIHMSLGKELRGVFDKIVLVGENNRTKNLAKGLNGECEFIKDGRNEYFKKVEQLKGKYGWIFLENDVTENY